MIPYGTLLTEKNLDATPRAGAPDLHRVLDDIHVEIRSDVDIVTSRRCGRALAARLRFDASDCTMVATAISELARNILLYARSGEIVLRAIWGTPIGLIVIARDEGNGIANITEAMRDGYSTSGRLGVGLPGVKRLMDDFEITSKVGEGTVVTVKKWNRAARGAPAAWRL